MHSIKLCSYNFLLKEVPNNNNSMHVANNIMLNEVPNRINATGIANNVRLTTMGAIQFSMAAVYLVIIQKSLLTRGKR